MLYGNGIQLRRKSKHDMEIRHIEKFAFPRLYPCFTLVPLTGGAMPVSATIVTDVKFVAAITFIYMATHSRCTAPTDGVQGAPVPGRKGFGGDILLLHFHHISHLVAAAH